MATQKLTSQQDTAGSQAEKLAAVYLQEQGLKLVTSNYRCRFGEIDLIMRDDKTLIFVEVRLSSSGSFGGAAYSINASKQKKLIITAEHYLQQHSAAAKMACRFDAILMDKTSAQNVQWIQNAFDA
ncbi:MAG: YraN family protein [Methylophilaceae bacterium]|nr:YraN family protein [Methyloradius sp.]